MSYKPVTSFKHPASEKGKVIRALLESNEGRVFRVNFVKVNGETRKMQCKLGVKKFLKGGESTVKDYEQYLVINEFGTDQYRTVNCSTVTKISMRGMKLEFN